MVGAPQGEGLSALGHGQYGWPECKEFQAFGGGQGGRRAAGLGFECVRAGSVLVARTKEFKAFGSKRGSANRKIRKQKDMQAGRGGRKREGKERRVLMKTRTHHRLSGGNKIITYDD